MAGYGIPYAPRSVYDGRNSRITDLIMEQGRIQAQGQAERGAILGNAVAGIGQQVAGAIQQHAERKEQSKRSLAFDAAVASGDPRRIISVLGPRDGPAVVNALKATTPDGIKAYSDRMALARDVAKGILAVPKENRAQAIEFGKNSLLQNGVFKPEELPEVIDEPFLRQLSAYGAEQAKPQGLINVPAGGVVLDPETRQPVFTAPTKPAEPEPARVVGRSLVSPEGKVIYRDPAEPRAEKDERLVQIAGPSGGAIWVRESEAVGQPAAQAARSVTGQERTALAFYNRAKQASEDIAPLEEKISKAGLGSQLQLQAGVNLLQTKEQQQYRQAQRSFTEARLRKESGAAIPDHEYANDARTYFAQPGDKPELMEQKRRARAVVLDGLKFGSGKAYEEYYGESARPQAGAAPSATPPAAAPQGGQIAVTAPNGKIYYFSSKAAADAAKRQMGIR